MPELSDLYEQRRQRLVQILADHHADPEDYDHEVEEDVRPYISGDSLCEQFLCITLHDDKPYFLPDFGNRDGAELRAVEYINDDLFSEIPLAVVDLDSGKEWTPDWDSLQWK